jgi:hypothetical protein
LGVPLPELVLGVGGVGGVGGNATEAMMVSYQFRFGMEGSKLEVYRKHLGS